MDEGAFSETRRSDRRQEQPLASSPIKQDAEDAVLTGETAPAPKPKQPARKPANSAPAKRVRPGRKPLSHKAPVKAEPIPVQAGSIPVEPTRHYNVKPAVPAARIRKRHIALLFSFLLMVVFPTALVGYYLWNRAADQYASFAGFSVQREEAGAGFELPFLGPGPGSTSSSDPEILYDFLNSQTLVAGVEAELGLSEIWSRPLENDPWFSFDPSGSIEDLVAHWERMVQIGYDGQSGLLEVRVLAFTPEDATAITTTILNRSSDMINALSAEAREDAIGYAVEELAQAEDRLAQARIAVTQFRRENQIVDPTGDVAVQTGLLANLEAQRAEAIIALDLLRDTVPETDPRILQAQRRIEVIDARIAEERSETGQSPAGGEASMADVVGEFESLVVEREFAEQLYVAALAELETAKAEARRKTRYLATHVAPTTAETARYPQRILLLFLFGGFATLAWIILGLTAYSLRDRR